MRDKTMVLLLVFGVISATSGTVAAVAAWGKSTSACVSDSSEDDEDTKAVFQRALLKHAKRYLPLR